MPALVRPVRRMEKAHDVVGMYYIYIDDKPEIWFRGENGVGALMAFLLVLEIASLDNIKRCMT